MEFRHEWKHEINAMDMRLLRRRMLTVAQHDEHTENGVYRVRSLYFDTPFDTVLHEKLDGVGRREKFRIRYYNGDASLIRLEKKSRLGDLCRKQIAVLTREQAQSIIDGETDWMRESAEALVQELHRRITIQRLRPRTIVEYTREAFVYSPGNVRVTLDHNICTGLGCTALFDAGCVTLPAPDTPMILEVKWDAYLPDIIRTAVQLGGRQSCAFSKYAACRSYD